MLELTKNEGKYLSGRNKKGTEYQSLEHTILPCFEQGEDG